MKKSIWYYIGYAIGALLMSLGAVAVILIIAAFFRLALVGINALFRFIL